MTPSGSHLVASFTRRGAKVKGTSTSGRGILQIRPAALVEEASCSKDTVSIVFVPGPRGPLTALGINPLTVYVSARF